MYEIAERYETLQAQFNALSAAIRDQKRLRLDDDPWHPPNIERAMAQQHISIQQRVELAQLAATYLFSPAQADAYKELRLIAQALPDGIIDWENQRVLHWTTCPEALELAHALYYERDATLAKTEFQSKVRTFELQAKLADAEQKTHARIREHANTTNQLTQAQQELKRTQEALESARRDLAHQITENAHMLRITRDALQKTGNKASDIVLDAKNEFLAQAKELGVDGNTSHELAQVILRSITRIKCLYNGIPGEDE